MNLNNSQLLYGRHLLTCLRGKILIGQYRFKEAKDSFLQCLQNQEKINYNKGIADNLIQLAICHELLEDLELAEKYAMTALKLKNEINDMSDIADTLATISRISHQKGDFDRALKYSFQSIKAYEKIKNDRAIAGVYGGIGVIYRYKGNIDLAIEYHKKALDSKHNLDDGSIASKQEIAISMHNLGSVYMDLGEFEKSINYFNQSIDFNTITGNNHEIANGQKNLGSIYLNRGELDVAMEWFKKSLVNYKTFGHERYVASVLSSIGILYFRKSNFKKSMKYLDEALTLSMNQNNLLFRATILLHLLKVNSLTMRLKEAAQNLIAIKKINDIENSVRIDLIYRFSIAYDLSHKSRPKDKLKAIDLFEKIIGENVIDTELTVEAMSQLTNLLIEELKISKEPEIINQANIILNKLEKIGNKHHSIITLVETLILQAKLAFLNENIERMEILFDQAELIASEKNLGYLLRQIDREKEILHSQLKKWKKLYHQNFQIKAKTKFSKFQQIYSRQKELILKLLKKDVVDSLKIKQWKITRLLLTKILAQSEILIETGNNLPLLSDINQEIGEFLDDSTESIPFNLETEALLGNEYYPPKQLNEEYIANTRMIGINGLMILLFLQKEIPRSCSVKLIEKTLSIPKSSIYNTLKKLRIKELLCTSYYLDHPDKSFYNITYEGEEFVQQFYKYFIQPLQN